MSQPQGSDVLFEQAIKIIADTVDGGQALPDRYAVIGSGTGSGSATGASSGNSSSEWLINGGVIHKLRVAGEGIDNTFDIYQWWTYSDQKVIVGANLGPFWKAPGSAWQNFIGSFNIMQQILLKPGETNSFSPGSMASAGFVVENLNAAFGDWQQTIKQWMDGIDVPDSDFQGSAAGVFKTTMLQFVSQLEALNTQLTTTALAQQLNGTQQIMVSAVNDLYTAFSTWYGQTAPDSAGRYPDNSPVLAMWNQFNLQLQGATLHFKGGLHFHIDTPYGDPSQQAWWDTLQTAAQQNWKASLQPLDNAADAFVEALNSAYSQVDALITTNFVPPVTVTPAGSDLGGDGSGAGNIDLGGADGSGLISSLLNGGLSGGLNGSGAGLNGAGLNGAGLNLGDGTGDLSLGTGTGLGLNGSGSGINGVALPRDPSQAIALTGGGSGLNGSATVDGPNGLPLLDANGDPVTVPPGSTIAADGSVIGPDGKPVLGPDGKPLKVPPGSTVAAADDFPLTGGGSGVSTIGLDGPPPTGLDDSVSGAFGKGLSIGGGGGGGLDIGGGLGSGTSVPRLLSSGAGLSDQARDLVDNPMREDTPGTTGEDPTELAAAENAAEEGEMLGRVATVGGGAAATGEEPPMMPPMSGGMGGQGGGAGSAKKTWVTEDEESWGTASAMGSGVIGR